MFVLAAISVYSRFQRHSARPHEEHKGDNAPSAGVVSPPAPTPPSTESESQPGPQQNTPALVKHENVTSNSGTAVMKLNSNPPAAEVELDGKATGKRTPTELQIGRGRHRVSIRMPGFQTSSVTVKVVGGEEFEYSPDLAVSMPNVAVPNIPIPDLSNLQELTKDRTQAEFWQRWAGRKFGSGPKLVVNSKPPGASIYIDGEDSGQRSPSVIPLKPGKYHVRLVLEGFNPIETDLIVTQNKPTIFNPILKSAEADK